MGGRLGLDDALKQVQENQADPEKAFEGWSQARIRAYQMIDQNPNSYYYRFNAPGDVQRKGQWDEDERKVFFKRLEEVGANGQWGIFAMKVPGRVGYQVKKKKNCFFLFAMGLLYITMSRLTKYSYIILIIVSVLTFIVFLWKLEKSMIQTTSSMKRARHIISSTKRQQMVKSKRHSVHIVNMVLVEHPVFHPPHDHQQLEHVRKQPELHQVQIKRPNERKERLEVGIVMMTMNRMTLKTTMIIRVLRLQAHEQLDVRVHG